MNGISTLTTPFVGTLADLSAAGDPLVKVSSARNGALVEARSCVPLGVSDVGRSVVVVFEEQSTDKPIIVGVLGGTRGPATESVLPLEVGLTQTTVDVDGQRIVLTAQEEVVLKCGKASITLTRAGKILIRGAYVSSHSTGVNRIKGSSVEIN